MINMFIGNTFHITSSTISTSDASSYVTATVADQNDRKKLVYTNNICTKKINTVKGQWSAQEDSLLLQSVKEHGLKKWSQIAEIIPGRTGKQCRERWSNHLQPNIKKEAWSEEEEMILIEAHKELGTKWSKIAKKLTGRTENTIKNHWNATKRRVGKHKRKSTRTPTLLENYIKNGLMVPNSDVDHDYHEPITDGHGNKPNNNDGNFYPTHRCQTVSDLIKSG